MVCPIGLGFQQDAGTDGMDIIPQWEMNGFGGAPAEHTATGVERVFRCYGNSFRDDAGNWHGSRKEGNCFWVFRQAALSDPVLNCQFVPRDLLNVEFLERNLNAALWNNTYHMVGMFQLKTGVKYLIGSIGHDTRGIQRNVIFKRQSGSSVPEDLTHVSSEDHTGGPKVLRQVTLLPPWSADPPGAMSMVAEYPVEGRERYLGARSRRWN